jgi:hypothetical protein
VKPSQAASRIVGNVPFSREEVQMGRTVMLLASFMLLLATGATAETQTLNFTDFDEVSVGYGMRASIRQSDGYRVEATGALEDLERLEVKKKGGRLEFSLKSGWARWFGRGQITLAITLPRLRRLALSGGSTGSLEMQMGSSPFSAALSGGSSLDGRLGCGDVDLALSGGSRAGLSGTGRDLSLSGSGGSQYRLRSFAAAGNVNVNLSGGSEATVALSGELSAALSGGSDVAYYGNATLSAVHASGGSRVRKGT